MLFSRFGDTRLNEVPYGVRLRVGLKTSFYTYRLQADNTCDLQVGILSMPLFGTAQKSSRCP